MHRVPAAVLGLLLLTGAGAATPPMSGEREIVVANRSGRTVNEIYISPTSSEEWGPDRLGDGTVEPRQSRRVKLGPGTASARDCVFDVQIVYSDASREERRGVDLCRTHLLAFDASSAVAPPNPDSGEHSVLIANESGMPIQQILISPAEAGDWGDDRLSNSSLSVHETAPLRYRGGCLADVRVVFENRSAEERRGLDLCALGGLTVTPGWTVAAQLLPPRPPQSVSPPVPMAVTVVNHAGRTIRELYLFPDGGSGGDTTARGPDRLGPQKLDDGGQISVDVSRPPGLCRYAARVVYGGKIPDQDIAGLDLCQTTNVVVPPLSLTSRP